ncbi:hypothetical protein AVEN_193842-1 [Araneus ventricosus]|uniref:Uncharacterized protein n=1 Tax=Araneus ventricosus TaxID=182803 RepID=A0A4Y2W035_ARAVE|nr:hypothetical protein AVEN_193842-1 [Araneus ventricosus]
MQYRVKLSQSGPTGSRTDVPMANDTCYERKPSTSTIAETVVRMNERKECSYKEMSKVEVIAIQLDILFGSVHKIIVHHLQFRKVCAFPNRARMAIGRWTFGRKHRRL